MFKWLVKRVLGGFRENPLRSTLRAATAFDLEIMRQQLTLQFAEVQQLLAIDPHNPRLWRAHRDIAEGMQLVDREIVNRWLRRQRGLA